MYVFTLIHLGVLHLYKLCIYSIQVDFLLLIISHLNIHNPSYFMEYMYYIASNLR